MGVTNYVQVGTNFYANDELYFRDRKYVGSGFIF